MIRVIPDRFVLRIWNEPEEAREESKLLRERKASGSSIGAEGTIRRESDKQ